MMEQMVDGPIDPTFNLKYQLLKNKERKRKKVTK